MDANLSADDADTHRNSDDPERRHRAPGANHQAQHRRINRMPDVAVDTRANQLMVCVEAGVEPPLTPERVSRHPRECDREHKKNTRGCETQPARPHPPAAVPHQGKSNALADHTPSRAAVQLLRWSAFGGRNKLDSPGNPRGQNHRQSEKVHAGMICRAYGFSDWQSCCSPEARGELGENA